MHKKILATFGILIATCAVTAANATVINTGEINVLTPANGRGNFSFLIEGISTIGVFDEGTRLLLPGYEGTAFVGNHSLVGSTDMFYGNVDSAFVLWNKPGAGGSPIHTMLGTTAAGALLVAGQTIYQTEFTFMGSLCGSFVVNTPCDVIFPSLSGKGVAEFTFNESIGAGGFHLFTPTKAKYTFVPEPGTLALFCLGLVAIIFTQRRRMRRQA